MHVYIIDTGIRATHEEFAGRVGQGYDALSGGDNPEDCTLFALARMVPCIAPCLLLLIAIVIGLKMHHVLNPAVS